MSDSSAQRDSNLESDVDDLLQFNDHLSDLEIGRFREELGRTMNVVTVIIRERRHEALDSLSCHLSSSVIGANVAPELSDISFLVVVRQRL